MQKGLGKISQPLNLLAPFRGLISNYYNLLIR